jgi:hypothetical protein
MTRFAPEWEARERKRWLRPDWHRYVRPDAYRWVRPGHEHLLPPEYWERYGPARPGERTGNVVHASIWRRSEPPAQTLDDDPRPFAAQARELRCELAALRFRLALKRLFDHCAKANFDPSQPRVPRGHPDGGQWTDDPRWAGSANNNGTDDHDQGSEAPLILSDVTPDEFIKPGAQLAQALGRQTDLLDEETRGGHTIKEHVGKTPNQLIARMQAERFETPFATIARKRVGSFPSLEAANKLVNSTLARNRSTVELVASGKVTRAFIKSRFQTQTGIEAYAASERSRPYVRDTFGVGVEIRHDPHSPNSYTVVSAYPRED